jgi:hypothetical protein
MDLLKKLCPDANFPKKILSDGTITDTCDQRCPNLSDMPLYDNTYMCEMMGRIIDIPRCPIPHWCKLPDAEVGE